MPVTFLSKKSPQPKIIEIPDDAYTLANQRPSTKTISKPRAFWQPRATRELTREDTREMAHKLRDPPRSRLFFGLQSQSPKNGSFLMDSRRLSGVLAAKVRQLVSWRLVDIKEARIWRAFLMPKKDIL
ncbi:MAG: hypothetical protein ACRCV5_07020 [Afipia sp.]